VRGRSGAPHARRRGRTRAAAARLRGRPAARGAAGATVLGPVAAPAAAAYLLSLAEQSDGAAGREAVFAAALADSAVAWPRLLRLARDAARPAATRREATFWVAEAAGEVVAPGGSGASDDATEATEVREHAVFALSQRPRDESVPALIRVARTNRDAGIRRRALFWLGQSNDPRALDEFEAVLRRR
jgi:HEAT repeat protein